jgi:hypothetical protein
VRDPRKPIGWLAAAVAVALAAAFVVQLLITPV